MSQMEISPEAISPASMYKLLVGSVVPRPIGWISSISETGVYNLAPFSFFNVASANPPHVLFCPTVRGTDGGRKDTLHNIRETGEFVVNIVTAQLGDAMNLTATEFPPDVDEFAMAGLTAVPSAVVRPPRVGESPIHFECQLAQIVDLGGGHVVIGRVVHVHVDDRVLIGGDKIDVTALQPIGKLAGNAYTRVTDLFDLIRPPTQLLGK
jgi:flavin reductase (DIM6/NTAB) family NADH-FMN oxidoreductase RutF